MQLIDNAKEEIHFQTYIFDADETGTLIIDKLINASSRGVRVLLLCDGYATDFPSSVIQRFKEAGIQFRYFEPLFSSEKFYFGRRLHHKVIVVDSIDSLVGGMNISDRYNDINGQKAWLDFAVHCKGQASVTLKHVCERFWEKYRIIKKLPNEEKRIFFKTINHEEIHPARVRVNDWIKGKNEISRSYNEIFRRSQKNITIMCSYFLPGRLFRMRMKATLKRGVKIKIVLAGVSDVWLSKYAVRYLYRWMLRNKIELYEYNQTVLHAKVATCDNELSTVGSYNINNLSAYASTEVNVDVKDVSFARHLEDEIDKIIREHCIQITNDSYLKRRNIMNSLMEWSAFTIARFLLFLFTSNLKRETD